MVIGKAKSDFPPVGASLFFVATGVALIAGGYQMWRNGTRLEHASRYFIGYWRGRTTVAMPFGVGMCAVGAGVLFGNLVKPEHVITRVLMILGGLSIAVAVVCLIWMPPSMRPGAGADSK